MQINGSLLRSARLSKCLKQHELAEGICTPAMISQIETGKANPSDELINRLCGKLGIDVSDLQK
ncbi:helix-turn-helix domain-containing protein [Tumebacillus permanentifrigoris]|uniref:helix-turn-helix domain-containing protein n=1 Tax=Tumebacillus permanentifrigoris TaxID=378543 RepID=UPI000D6C8738